MGINKVTLLGVCGCDPEIRYTEQQGVKVATLSLATSERGYTAGNGTQVPERTEWHNLVFWRGAADVVERYVKKGHKLYVDGKIRTRSYDAADGTKRYVTEIHVENLELLTPKPAEPQRSAPISAATGARPLQDYTPNPFKGGTGDQLENPLHADPSFPI